MGIKKKEEKNINKNNESPRENNTLVEGQINLKNSIRFNKLRFSQFLILCIILNIIIPLFAKKLTSYNAIINTVDVYSYKSIIQDRRINNAVDELDVCDPELVIKNISEGDVCTLFDEKFEYIDTDDEIIFISRLDFFPTRIDVTFDRIEDMKDIVNSFICINNTLIPEFSYLLHSTEYHFHKKIKEFQVPNFIDIQHHVHISNIPYQRRSTNKNEPCLNITIGSNKQDKGFSSTIRYPKIDFLTALKRAGINTFNQLSLKRYSFISKHVRKILSALKISTNNVDIMVEWLTMLTTPLWGESEVINIRPNRELTPSSIFGGSERHIHGDPVNHDEIEEKILNDFNLQSSYTLLLLGRLSDVSHTTLFRCPTVYFVSEGLIMEGYRIWLPVVVNCVALYHSFRILFKLKFLFCVPVIFTSLIMCFCRPILFINISFKMLTLFCLMFIIEKYKNRTDRKI